MKKVKTYLQIGLPLLMLAVLLSGIPMHSTEAYFGNQSMQQIRFQNMSQQNMQETIRLLTQLRDRLQQLLQLRDQSYSDSEVQIATRAATDIETDEAMLRGRVVDFNRSDYADVWFEYNTDRSDLDQKTSAERIDDNEDGDFERLVTGLREDTVYYFRAVGEDDNGDRDYGVVFNFRTDDSDRNNEPDVTTLSATDIRDDSADLHGSVDMNEFNNGEVFFVYGESENQVEAVEDDFDTYTDVDEDGDDLKKIRVDTDLDGQYAYSEEVESLDDNTTYYFSICMGYEDEDGDEMLVCGGVRTFTTD